MNNNIPAGLTTTFSYGFKEKTWHSIRMERDSRLNGSDWAALPDATPKPSQQSWLDYRQKLRDVTRDFSTPEEVVWPQKPR